MAVLAFYFEAPRREKKVGEEGKWRMEAGATVNSMICNETRIAPCPCIH
jgi:hypothetical protein